MPIIHVSSGDARCGLFTWSFSRMIGRSGALSTRSMKLGVLEAIVSSESEWSCFGGAKEA